MTDMSFETSSNIETSADSASRELNTISAFSFQRSEPALSDWKDF